MENTILCGIELKIFNRIGWIPTAQHVVPLKDLMQNDAVEKTAKSKAEKDTGARGELSTLRLNGGGHPRTLPAP